MSQHSANTGPTKPAANQQNVPRRPSSTPPQQNRPPNTQNDPRRPSSTPPQPNRPPTTQNDPRRPSSTPSPQNRPSNTQNDPRRPSSTPSPQNRPPNTQNDPRRPSSTPSPQNRPPNTQNDPRRPSSTPPQPNRPPQSTSSEPRRPSSTPPQANRPQTAQNVPRRPSSTPPQQNKPQNAQQNRPQNTGNVNQRPQVSPKGSQQSIASRKANQNAPKPEPGSILHADRSSKTSLASVQPIKKPPSSTSLQSGHIVAKTTVDHTARSPTGQTGTVKPAHIHIEPLEILKLEAAILESKKVEEGKPEGKPEAEKPQGPAIEIIGGIERLQNQPEIIEKTESKTWEREQQECVEESPLKSNLKKKKIYDEVISVNKLGEKKTQNAIPETILQTVIKDNKPHQALIAQDIVDVCLDNVFTKEEDMIEETIREEKKIMVMRQGCLTGSRYYETYDEIGLGERYFAGMTVYIDEIHMIDSVSGRQYTKAEVLDLAIKLAAKMQSMGITEDDIIVICSRTHTEQNIALLGTLLLGAIVAPIDIDMTIEDCSRLIGSLMPKFIFCDNRSKGNVQSAMREHKIKCHLILFTVDKPLYNGFERFVSDFEFKGFTVTKIEDPREKIAAILPTTGTTGHPKLCALTHFNITWRSLPWKHKILKGSRKIMSWFPLCWFMQMVMTCSCYELPVTQVLQNRFSERAACKVIYEHQVDRVVLGTVYALRLSKHVARIDYDMGCLRAIVIGGATSTPTRISNIWNGFHYVRIYQCYGCTETGIVCLHCINDTAKIQKKAASSGLVLEENIIKVVDFKTKEHLPPNDIGLIMIKAEGMMKGYYKNPKLTAQLVDEDGFFDSEDAGCYSPTDHIYIKGKVADMVFKGGMVATTLDVDEFLIRHPNVEDVATITNGDSVVSFIIKRKDKTVTEGEIYYLLEKYNFPKPLIPKSIIFTEFFPRTSIGKVKKHILIEIAFSTKKSISDTSL